MKLGIETGCWSFVKLLKSYTISGSDIDGFSEILFYKTPPPKNV